MSLTASARIGAVAAFLVSLSACASSVEPVGRPSPPVAPVTSSGVAVPPTVEAETPGYENASRAPIRRASAAPLRQEEAERALASFKLSCPKLLARTDQSGLTLRADWEPLCAVAATLSPASATTFFERQFDWVEIAGGEAFATGYFEPQIEGSRTRTARLSSPVYRVPDDLTRGTFSDGSGEGRGRRDASGNFVRYFDRAAIEGGALAGRGLEIAYADPVDLFFLQIQGSGRLLLPGGEVVRIGYANQNGREYVAIGRLLRERGIMESGTITMEAIQNYLREDPARGAALMNENPSYIFFRELKGAGPLGALEVAVTPLGSVAADPKFVPLGAPVWLDMQNDVADGLWVAQDTGGAIKGANRFDTFWGAGAAAKRIAGEMSSSGTARILLPRTAVARALAQR